MTSIARKFCLSLLLLMLAACSQTGANNAGAPRPSAAMSPAAERARPLIAVHKSQYCGCCHLWVKHVEQAGFRVQVENREDLDAVKQALGVPAPLASCHTAEIAGYVIEGHVPAEDIRRLLAEKPDVRGLAVPGMPRGSPGMEMPDGRRDAYSVLAIQRDGSTREFARH